MSPPQITPDNHEFLRTQVYRESGIVLDDSKLYLIESRLAPILQTERIGTLNDLCALLRATNGSPLRQRVVEAMTTNETLFFRDPPAFAALHKTVLPELVERRKMERRLRIWSAAASTGQEAYSIAILLREMGLPGWDIRVLGTDLNAQVLDRARTGRYMQLEVNRGLPAKYLVRYFRQNGPDWQIAEELRRMVEFRTWDLRQSPQSLGSFDLILCRNVLIYFDVATKKKILSDFRGVLAPQGHLLLGCAESTFNLDTVLTRRQIDQTTFYQAP